MRWISRSLLLEEQIPAAIVIISPKKNELTPFTLPVPRSTYPTRMARRCKRKVPHSVSCHHSRDSAFTCSSIFPLAAPAVCGLIATYMAYDTIPWDDNKMNNERVNEIRNHPRSDKCSVARGSDPVVRTIWNGIPKPDYEQVVISVLKTSKGWSLSVAMMSNVNSHSGGVEVSRARKCYTIKVGKSVGSCRETNPCAK